jgi:hypothetical protein
MIFVPHFPADQDSRGTTPNSSPVRGRMPHRPRPSSTHSHTPAQTPSPVPGGSDSDGAPEAPRPLPPPRMTLVSIQRRPHLRPSRGRTSGTVQAPSTLRRSVQFSPTPSEHGDSASQPGTDDPATPSAEAPSEPAVRTCCARSAMRCDTHAVTQLADETDSTRSARTPSQNVVGAPAATTPRRSVLQVTDWDGL